jgi:hypothetical protein
MTRVFGLWRKVWGGLGLTGRWGLRLRWIARMEKIAVVRREWRGSSRERRRKGLTGLGMSGVWGAGAEAQHDDDGWMTCSVEELK